VQSSWNHIKILQQINLYNLPTIYQKLVRLSIGSTQETKISIETTNYTVTELTKIQDLQGPRKSNSRTFKDAWEPCTVLTRGGWSHLAVGINYSSFHTAKLTCCKNSRGHIARRTARVRSENYRLQGRQPLFRQPLFRLYQSSMWHWRMWLVNTKCLWISGGARIFS